jgi:hypothetical protein
MELDARLSAQERNAKPSGGKKLNGKVPAPYKKPAGLLHK